MKARDSKKKSRTDLDKLFSMADKDIDYSDIPALDEKFLIITDLGEQITY